MLYIKIATLVILFCASILLLVWVFRPGSKKEYDEISKIPLQDDKENIKDVSPTASKKNKNGKVK